MFLSKSNLSTVLVSFLLLVSCKIIAPLIMRLPFYEDNLLLIDKFSSKRFKPYCKHFSDQLIVDVFWLNTNDL